MTTSIIIGTEQNYDHEVSLSTHERLKHTYVIGKSGVGKSTALRNMILQDIHAGRGVGVLDPHADLVESLLDHIPRNRTRDVVYFDTTDIDHPIGFNVFAGVDEASRPYVAASIVSAFKHIWGDSWGPRLEYILYNTVAALLEVRGATLLFVPRFLADPTYRQALLTQVHNPIVRGFWLEEFARYDPRLRAEALSPVQNKIGQFLLSPVLRHIVGQTHSGFDLRLMLDTNRILLVNLSRGFLGDQGANILGSLLLARIASTALSRQDVAATDRQPWMLFADEFQNFTTDSIAVMLSEIRKFGVGLTFAHQYLDQLTPSVRASVFGNVANFLAFRVGAPDAEILAPQFDDYTPALLSSLARYECVARLSRNGSEQASITVRSLPPLEFAHNRGPVIRQESRARFGTPRSAIEAKVARYFQSWGQMKNPAPH